MNESTQLEREVEASRDRVERTVDALKGKMDSSALLEEVGRLFSGNASAMAGNLGRQVRENPLPVVLIGAGLAWLLFGSSRKEAAYRPPRIRSVSAADEGVGFWDEDHIYSDARPGDDRRPYRSYSNEKGVIGKAADWVSGAGSTIGSAAHGVVDAMKSAGSTVGNAAATVGHAAETAIEGVKQAASGAKHAATGAGHAVEGAYATVRETTRSTLDGARQSFGQAYGSTRQVASSAYDYAHRAERNVARFINDEPLAVGAIGFAVGAAVGAMLPPTPVEDRLMGSTRDSLLTEAERVAAEGYEAVKEYAGEAVEAAKEEVTHEYEKVKESAARALDDAKAGVGELLARTTGSATAAEGAGRAGGTVSTTGV